MKRTGRAAYDRVTAGLADSLGNGVDGSQVRSATCPAESLGEVTDGRLAA